MSGIEGFITKKNEFKENYEGLKTEPNLISIDGPDGVGKTEISKRLIEKLQEEFIKEGKNPSNIVYLKYTKLMDSESQKAITKNIKECRDETGAWDKNKIDFIVKLWSSKLNRSYGDHILPLIKEGKTIIMDRSEIDLFRACIEWGDKELLDTIVKYMKDGTLTHGINAGNRILISSDPKDIYKNLNARDEPLSQNDPRSLEETYTRTEKEKVAENLITTINEKDLPNVIKIKNERQENEEERKLQFEKIVEDIMNKLKK